MKCLLRVVLMISVLVTSANADEVQLKNGKTWVNVNILEQEESFTAIYIFTSKQKKIRILKSDILGYRFKEFDTSQKSELLDLGEDHLAVVEKFYIPMEGDSIDTDLDSLILKRNAEIVRNAEIFRIIMGI